MAFRMSQRIYGSVKKLPRKSRIPKGKVSEVEETLTPLSMKVDDEKKVLDAFGISFPELHRKVYDIEGLDAYAGVEGLDLSNVPKSRNLDDLDQEVEILLGHPSMIDTDILNPFDGVENINYDSNYNPVHDPHNDLSIGKGDVVFDRLTDKWKVM